MEQAAQRAAMRGLCPERAKTQRANFGVIEKADIADTVWEGPSGGWEVRTAAWAEESTGPLVCIAGDVDVQQGVFPGGRAHV